MGVEDDFHKAPVVAPRAHGVHEKAKALGLFDCLVPLVEQRLDGLLLQDGALLLVGDARVGRDVEDVRVFLYQAGAKAVYRADLGAVDERRLPAQAAVFRLAGDALGDCIEYARTQLVGRGVCVGDDEEPVDVGGAALIRDAAEQPLDEHLRLAGAGRRRDEQRPAPVCDNRLLLTREFIRHGSSSLQ